MSKNLSSDKLKISGPEYFFNYELSWLKFNERVLAEAQNEKNKLLERVRFISIVCSNLDEFFQKRVGGLKRQKMAGMRKLSVDGLTPTEQLKAIRGVVLKMLEDYRYCFFDSILPDLGKNGIHIKKFEELNAEQKKICDEFFIKQIYPIITPLAVDEAHPFPFISNQSLSFAIELKNPKNNKILFSRIKIPTNRPRFIQVQKKGRDVIFIPIEELILSKIDHFFTGMEVLSAHIFRVTRNASIKRNEEEADDLLEMIEDELRERRFAEIVRLEIDKRTPERVKKYLKKNLDISKNDVYEMSDIIGLASLSQIADLNGYSTLKNKPWSPVQHPVFKNTAEDDGISVVEAISNGDFMVHHPYHSFELSTQRFIEEAASDPNVLAIKQTLYRTSDDSPIMHALMAAAESGKQVAVLVEIQARFDEERNINWAQKLENSGVHVVYGWPGLKIHTKLTMVVREEDNNLKTYCHIGTGNYHPVTARIYEDFGYFTCNPTIGEDVTDVFNLLTGYAPDQQFRKLLVAPKYMRNKFTRLIDNEIKHAQNGKGARIIAKMNSLEDPLIIQKLYYASSQGVKIDLIVRGVCRLIPQKKGLSENIMVHSIIGRFLEHSRIYYFKNGGEYQYSIGSADWMHRNLDMRVEAITPINENELKEYLSFVINIYLNDNVQRSILDADGNYTKCQQSPKKVKIATHKKLMSHIGRNKEPVPLVSRKD